MKRKTKEKTLKNKKQKEKEKVLSKPKEKEKEKERPKPKQPEPPYKINSQLKSINPFQSNEFIVKSILDKIISIAVRNAYLNSICTELDQYYFNYLENQLNAMFSTNNIFYSDEPEKPNINNSFFWKTEYSKCNTWVEITEPTSLKCDRFENACINYISIKRDTSIDNGQNKPSLNKENIKKDKKNNITDKKNKNIFKKFNLNLKNNKNDLDVLEENSSGESLDETKSHIRNITRRSFYGTNSEKNTMYNNKSNSLEKNFSNSKNMSKFSNNKRSRNEVLEMPSKEIPGIYEEYNFGKYEPGNINFLRREREDQIMRKAKENKKIYFNFNLKKNDNEPIQIEINDNRKEIKNIKNIKMFDSNKLTFDSNGKIISFKPMKIDILSKDFNFLKNSVRAFRKKRTTLRKGTKAKEDKTESNKEKEKEKDNTTVIENVIKNPIDEIEGNQRNQYMKMISEKNEKIVPSGSNFSIMLPNIGVILKENDLVKQGNREFGKFFKKYSLEDYDKILKDYVPLQNKTMMLNKMGKVTKSPLTRTLTRKFTNIGINNDNMNNNNLMISSLSTKNNNLNNNSIILNNNSEISNPLINQEKDNDLNQNINNLNYTLLKNIKTKNSFNNSSLSSINNINNLSLNPNNKYEGSIRLNKMGISSLKVEFDSLQDLDYQNINNYYSPSRTGMRNINIFGKNLKEIFKTINKNNKVGNKSKDLNEFNKNIVTNKGWGNKTMRKNMSSENLLFGKHQTKYQAIREIGHNILNGIKFRMPRSRKINLQI